VSVINGSREKTVLDKLKEHSLLSLDEMFRDYAWGYFEVHAEQRLKAFQFFISIATALIGAFVVLVRYGSATKWMAGIGILLAFLAFVFWKLDCRTRRLVKNAEKALKFLDGQHNLPDIDGAPHPLRIFTRDDHFTKKASRYPLWSGHFSYSRCFEWVFIASWFAGMVSAIWCLWKFPV
jgi:hypothetical protein